MDMDKLTELLKTMLANNKEQMLATINANQEKMEARMDVNTKAMQENQETTARMDAKMGSMQDELISTIKNFKFNGKETTACQETMEARLEVEEPASVDTTPVVADDQEVPVEDAEVLSVAESRKRRRDGRNLAAVRRQKTKQDQNLDARRRRKGQERAQRKDGCRRSLVAARRETTRRAAVA
jgi:hypothetical protein